MDWFLYIRILGHERVKDWLYKRLFKIFQKPMMELFYKLLLAVNFYMTEVPIIEKPVH